MGIVSTVSDELADLKRENAILRGRLAELEREVGGDGVRALRRVLDAVPAIIARLDAEGRILFVNKYLPDQGPDSVLGKSFEAFVGPAGVGVARAAMETAKASGGPSTFRVSGPNGPSGEPCHYDATIVPVLEPDGRSSFCLVALDVTSDLERERAFEAIDDRLRQTQKLEALGSLTAGVAHNFNNMLAVILPFLDRAASNPARVDPELADAALHAARRATDMVKQLMLLGGRRRRRTSAQLDLASIVESAVDICRRTFESEVTVGFQPPPGELLVTCDETAIEQSVVNLLLNARDAVSDACRPNPTIRVTVRAVEPGDVPDFPGRRGGPYAAVEVEDNGPGMAEETRAHLFEPFFTTKGPDRGTGLGLATSHAVAREHGGHLLCRSEVGRGSTFAMYLPLELEEEKPAPRRTESAPAATSVFRVLVVEDDPLVRSITTAMLRVGGHVVTEAGSTSVGIERLESGPPFDVVLLDRSMPQESGRTMIGKIRQIAPRTKVVYFTGGDVPDKERALVDGVAQKPVTPSALLGILEHAVRGEHAGPHA